MSKHLETVPKKNCFLASQNLGADPGSRWAAFFFDQLGWGRVRMKNKREVTLSIYSIPVSLPCLLTRSLFLLLLALYPTYLYVLPLWTLNCACLPALNHWLTCLYLSGLSGWTSGTDCILSCPRTWVNSWFLSYSCLCLGNQLVDSL